MKLLRDIWKKAEARDLFVVSGLVVLAVGVGMVYLPAAFICVGLALLLIGIWGVPAWP